MAKWPKSIPWKAGKRKDWTFKNGYEVTAFKYPGSKGFKENKWEIVILFNGDPVEDIGKFTHRNRAHPNRCSEVSN